VFQKQAHTVYEFESCLYRQVRFSQWNCKAEKLFSLIAGQRFPGRAWLRRWVDIQPLLDTLHGRVVIVGHRLVVHPGIDHCRVEALVAQELLDRRHPAAGVQKLRRTRVAQPMGIHGHSHEPGRCGILAADRPPGQHGADLEQQREQGWGAAVCAASRSAAEWIRRTAR